MRPENKRLKETQSKGTRLVGGGGTKEKTLRPYAALLVKAGLTSQSGGGFKITSADSHMHSIRAHKPCFPPDRGGGGAMYRPCTRLCIVPLSFEPVFFFLDFCKRQE